ncbi:MAG: hypothetical protein ACRYGR_09130 [Janthinobacterium lividum]
MLNVFAYVAHIEIRDPLSLMFNGPSGHGKTELAMNLAELLQIDRKVIDCAQIQRGSELLGGTLGYDGARTGLGLTTFFLCTPEQGPSCPWMR